MLRSNPSVQCPKRQARRGTEGDGGSCTPAPQCPKRQARRGTEGDGGSCTPAPLYLPSGLKRKTDPRASQ